ncbi:MAG: hypothetical protein RIQ92_856 [Actinomycetota bacterium]
MYAVNTTVSVLNQPYLNELDDWLKNNFAKNQFSDPIEHRKQMAMGLMCVENSSNNSMNDQMQIEQLLEGYYEGNDASIEKFFTLFGDRLVHFATVILNDANKAKDAVQDVMIKLLETPVELRREKFRPNTTNVLGALKMRVRNRSIDLVRQQFRIAMGEELGFEDPVIRGHSIEFRINGEDPGRSFLPAPGRITEWQIPTGPGVRVDAGFRKGDVIGGNFDSLLAKLIVTGATREEAIQRSRRALAEFEIQGLATALPFHRAILEDSNYTENFKVYTSYIENEFVNEIPAYASEPIDTQTRAAAEKLVAEVNGKRFEILVHAPEPVVKRHRAKQASASGASGDGLPSPMQGTVVKIAVEEGQIVEAGDLIIVLEAMKMEQPLNAHKRGVIKNLKAVVGETVSSGTVLCDIIEA